MTRLLAPPVTGPTAPSKRASSMTAPIAVIAIGAVATAAGAFSTSFESRVVEAIRGRTSAAQDPTEVARARAAEGRSSAKTLAVFHETSGLTWEQIARAMGVSRRAVHHWASGDRMSSQNLEQLGLFVALVGGLPAGDAESKRIALLTPGPDGYSLFDRFRKLVAGSGVEINALPAPLSGLLGIDPA